MKLTLKRKYFTMNLNNKNLLNNIYKSKEFYMSKKIIVSLMIFVLSVVAVALPAKTVFADGQGSPVACNGNPNVNPNAANVKSSQTGTSDQVIVDVGAGNVVEGVCIKSGENMFGGEQHSQVLGNGIYEDNCYQVSGVGTQVATVTRLRDANDCQGISHVDVLFGKPVTPPEEGGRGGGSTTTTPTPTVPTNAAKLPETGSILTSAMTIAAVSLAGLASLALTTTRLISRFSR